MTSQALSERDEGYMKGFEEGFDEGYSRAINYLVSNPTSYERMRSGQYKEQIA